MIDSQVLGMKLLALSFFTLLQSGFFVPPATAANFEVEVIDLRPVREPTIHITMSGPIVAGDAVALSAMLDEHRRPEMRDILILMDSPGGSLTEGLAIGRIIAALPEITTAQVGSTEMPDAICASACVLAYLGADYRYLAERGRIGVHRFAMPGMEMDGAEALSLAQEMSAVLTEYMRAQRADPAFYERMTRTAFEGIDWVGREQLEAWRVVTGPIYDEWTEYLNVNGSVGLRFAQASLYGDNTLTLLCGERGLVGVASLNKPRLAMYGRMELAVDGGALAVEDYDILDQDETFVRTAFAIPAAYTARLAAARSFGARILLPSEYGFFGFEMRLRDDRLREMVETCRAAPPVEPEVGPSAMQPVRGIDYPGGDIIASGVRGIALEACLQLCEADDACRAVSYVAEMQWCWPKARIGAPIATPGVMSAVK